MKLFLFAGFLGSGKTTLILSLARELAETHGRQVCIIVNEVGEIGIDDKVMRKAGLDVWELYAGCVCCQLTSDLLTTLRKIAESYRPDIVILEASGVATPAGILDALRYYRGAPLAKVTTITVVDPTRLELLMSVLTPLATGQIRSADLLAVNRIDESTEAELAAALDTIRSLNDRAPIVLTSAKNALNTAPILEELLS